MFSNLQPKRKPVIRQLKENADFSDLVQMDSAVINSFPLSVFTSYMMYFTSAKECETLMHYHSSNFFERQKAVLD